MKTLDNSCLNLHLLKCFNNVLYLGQIVNGNNLAIVNKQTLKILYVKIFDGIIDDAFNRQVLRKSPLLVCSNFITNINIGPPHVLEQVFEGSLVGFSKGLPLSLKNSEFLDNFDYWSYT